MSDGQQALIATTERFVDFYGDDLLAILVHDEPYIALKSICDYLGLAWNAQYERVQRDPYSMKSPSWCASPKPGPPVDDQNTSVSP